MKRWYYVYKNITNETAGTIPYLDQDPGNIILGPHSWGVRLYALARNKNNLLQSVAMHLNVELFSVLVALINCKPPTSYYYACMLSLERPVALCATALLAPAVPLRTVDPVAFEVFLYYAMSCSPAGWAVSHLR